jgi:hypothetical protein
MVFEVKGVLGHWNASKMKFTHVHGDKEVLNVGKRRRNEKTKGQVK